VLRKKLQDMGELKKGSIVLLCTSQLWDWGKVGAVGKPLEPMYGLLVNNNKILTFDYGTHDITEFSSWEKCIYPVEEHKMKGLTGLAFEVFILLMIGIIFGSIVGVILPAMISAKSTLVVFVWVVLWAFVYCFCYRRYK